MTAPCPEPSRPIYLLRIEGRPDTAGIHALRAVLKILLRQYGFRCIALEELAESGAKSPEGG